MNCGRYKGGPKENELGECIASREGMGHSCWEIAGTMCGGVVSGTEAQKKTTCMCCQVYQSYNRLSGAKAADVRKAFPEEEAKYTDRLLASRTVAGAFGVGHAFDAGVKADIAGSPSRVSRY
jgi:hypothetical protein